MQNNNKISVLINTLNEENNIRNCLESVKWADELIVVDMYSDDKTVEIAKEYTDKIYYFERLGYADPARQYALEKATNSWILVIDADEMVPVGLKRELEKIMKYGIADVVRIPRNNYIFGHLMKGTGWGALQDMHYRFFKRDYVSFNGKIHAFTEITDDAKIYEIKNPKNGFIHFNHIDIEYFIEKLNRYTTIEAKNMFNNDKKPPKTFLEELFRIIYEFFNRFFIKGGYKDGFLGFYLALLMGAYRASAYFKYRLMVKYSSEVPKNKILKLYGEISRETTRNFKK
jgi:glycosyltransferase involved in cell wall biosynthesis